MRGRDQAGIGALRRGYTLSLTMRPEPRLREGEQPEARADLVQGRLGPGPCRRSAGPQQIQNIAGVALQGRAALPNRREKALEDILQTALDRSIPEASVAIP